MGWFAEHLSYNRAFVLAVKKNRLHISSTDMTIKKETCKKKNGADRDAT